MSKSESQIHIEIETGQNVNIDFEKLKKVLSCGQGLVPVAVQDLSLIHI